MAEADNKVNLVFCKRDLIIEKNTSVSKQWIHEFEDLQKKHPLFNRGVKVPGKKLLKSESLLDEPVNKIGEPVTVLFRKSIIDSTGYFNEQLSQLLDIEYWYRIVKQGSVVFLNEKLAGFRLHEHQTTAFNKNKEIKDYDLFPYILYKDYYWYLNYRVQKKLLFKHNPLFRKLSMLIS